MSEHEKPQETPDTATEQPLFHDLIDHPGLQRALTELEFEQPTPVQAEVIPRVLANKDLLVSAKTGSGKTAAFLVPVLQRLLNETPVNKTSTRVLILSPTRELARQIAKVAEQLCRFTPLKVGVICGGEDFKYQKAMLRKNPELLVATPGRLAEHVSTASTDFTGLEVLVLDEADRMLEMGLSEDVLRIAGQCRAERQTLLFSATLKQQGVRHLIKQVVCDQVAETLEIAADDNSIQQQIVLADDAKHKEKLLAASLAGQDYAQAIVFTNTKQRASELDGLLRYHGHRVSALHGDMSQDQRRQSLELFRQGRTRILVATDVAARGLDIEQVELVINLDMARNGDDYLHRIGRTGRADRAGRAISLIGGSEWNLMASIERYLGVRFERIQIPGLTASYQGPKKVKSSGKAAGVKKKTPARPGAKKAVSSASKSGKDKPKIKERARDRKNLGKRRAPSDPAGHLGDGFAPPRKKTDPEGS